MNRFARRAILSGVCLALGLVSSSAFGQESWDAIYVRGAKVGHTHVWVEPVKGKEGRDLVRVRVEWELTFKRGQDQAQMKLHYGTIETPDGSVLRLDTRTQAGEDDIRTHGDVIDGKMNLINEAKGKAQQEVIPWPADVRGPYGAELSLSRKKIQPGEVREVKTYLPERNKVCITRLTAKSIEPVEIGGQGIKRPLLRVEQAVLDDAGKPIPDLASTLWIDDAGQILKSHIDLLGGMDIFRTTKAGALAEGGGDFNLLTDSVIKCRKILGSEKTRHVLYRITMENDEPAAVFLNDRRQTVKAGDTKTAATIDVNTAGPTDAGEDEEPGPEFTRANPLINSEDPRVIAHMKKAVGRETDPWKKATAIQSWVSKNIQDKNFGVAFAPAAEVARNLRGDCTEHAVLVAAMCRAAGIPSRCAVGIVYADRIGGRDLSGFGAHMWNEVYVNHRWVAIDAAFNQSSVDATHLKLSTSSLDGVAPFEVFLPVLKVFNKITIEPIEVR